MEAPLEERRSRLEALLPRLQSAPSFLPYANDTLPWDDDPAAYRVLVLRASPLADVDQSLTHAVLYDLARRHCPDAAVDMAFLPPRADRPLLQAAGLAWPLGVRSLLPPGAFDLVLVSLSYVLECLNLPPMLRAAGLAPLAAQRRPGDPVLVLGGAAALSAQCLLEARPRGGWDSPCDAWFFGEFEDAAAAVLDACRSARADRAAALGRLGAAAGAVPGLWLPQTGGACAKATCRGDSPATAHYPVLNGPEAGTCRLQISHGCPYACSFCFEGYGRKPYRERPAAALTAQAANLRRLTGAEAIDVVSFNFNTHRELPALMAGLSNLFPHSHFMSQRLDILLSTKHLLENELALGKRSFTLGVEGISQRMRDYFEKGIDAPSLRAMCQKLIAARVKEIKFFYILSGLEEQSDLDEFAAFLDFLGQAARAQGGVRLVFSFGALMRMPFTPLQFGALELSRGRFEPLLRACRESAAAAGAECREAFRYDEYLVGQLLVLGGSEATALAGDLARAEVDYQDGLPPRALAVAEAFLARNADSLGALLAAKDADYPFPLAFVAQAETQAELHRRYLRACGRLASGAGRGPAGEEPPREQRPGPDLSRALAANQAAWQSAPSAAWLVSVAADLAGAEPQWLESWFARRLFECLPDACGFRGVRLLPVLAAEARQAWSGLCAIELKVDRPQPAREFLAGPGAPAWLLAELPGWTGEWRQLGIAVPLPGWQAAQAAAAGQALCAAAHVGATLRKRADGLDFEIAAKYRNKRQLDALAFDRLPRPELRLAIGRRFDFAAACRLLAKRGWTAWAPVRVQTMEWAGRIYQDGEKA